MISVEDYLWYTDGAVDHMVEMVTDLGDDLANRVPDLAFANSPYVLLEHCLGVMEHWGGHVTGGRAVERDRDAEFVASGSVADLVARTARAKAQLRADATAVTDPAAAARGAPLDPEDLLTPRGRTQGGSLVHVYEELAQHRGQMEILRDVLLAAAGRPPHPPDDS